MRGCRIIKQETRVHADGLHRIRRTVRRSVSSLVDDRPHSIRQIELSLCVRAVELGERGPERGGLEDIDRGVELPDLALLERGVLLLDDLPESAGFVTYEPAVRKRGLRLERENGHSGPFA